MIACLLIVDFATALERQEQQTPRLFLNKAGKVQAASFEAVQQGVRVGMRLQQAQAFCTEAVAVPFNPEPHTQAIRTITEVLSTFTNRIEIAPGFWEEPRKKRSHKSIHPSAAAIYLDLGKLTNLNELAGVARQINHTLWKNLRMVAHIGVASNKFTASIAARFAHPQHPKIVVKGQEATYLAALPITLLPLENEVQRRLRLLGIHTLGQLAELPSGALLTQFGAAGRLMHQLAQGQDNRPVPLLQAQPIEHLTLHLHGAVEDQLVIETILQGVACDLQNCLEKRAYTLRVLELTLHLDDGSQQHTPTTLRKPTGDGGQIGRALIRLLSQLKLSQGVVTVEVNADDLQPLVWKQLDLFGQEFAVQDKLQQLLENLTVRFGVDHFYQITLSAPDHRLPEKRFAINPVEAA